MSAVEFVEVYGTPYFAVEATKANYSAGKPYYRIKTCDSVICCVMNASDELLLAKQMRPNLGYETLEFPAGGMEDNEAPLIAAQREINEELGFECVLIYLGSFRLMMNRTINKEHLFIGLVSENNISEPEDGIELVKIPRKDFVDHILNNKFEQLAAVGILNLINIKFNIDFLKDDSVIDIIWNKNQMQSIS
jgi:ADP-ribose pyrophosphatase